ncbi:hypothetical protein ABBQ38_011209 [Trebouxia sp. C0009 RCD-2024]
MWRRLWQPAEQQPPERRNCQIRRRGSSMILLVLYGPRPHGPTRNVSPLVPSNVFVFMGYCKCASLAAATPAFF